MAEAFVPGIPVIPRVPVRVPVVFEPVEEVAEVVKVRHLQGAPVAEESVAEAIEGVRVPL